MSEHIPWIIVGGGLGGLSAAAVLAHHNVPVTILEREHSRHARTQGGMLDIHGHAGQRAIRAADLFDAFQAIVQPGGEATRVVDRHGVVRFEQLDDGRFGRPEVDRGDLRSLLLDALPEGTVRWNSQVTTVHRDTHGSRWVLDLADGERITTDLLIGADGAWSRVRTLVSSSEPAYTGISFIEADVSEADERFPVQAATMGAGMLFALDGATAVFGHRETSGNLHSYLAHRADEAWLDTIAPTDPEALRRAALALLDGWDNGIRGLIGNARAPLHPRRIYALRPDHRWERVPAVTLIGDAAHLMSPFAGEGANLAMVDGSELALALLEHPDDTETAVTQYETSMFARAKESAEESAEKMDMLFAPDAPDSLAAMFHQFAQQGGPKAAEAEA